MYFLIGISLLFGCFYAVHFGASLCSAGVWRMTRGRSMAWSGRSRSNFLCGLKLMPLAIAATFVLAFVLPAFLVFEPSVPQENLSYKVTLIAIISAGGLLAAVGRIFASWWQTRRLIRSWMKNSSPIAVNGLELPAHRIKHAFPVLAVVGTFRPRVFVAEKVLAGLEASELEASVAHEAGHIASRDNLKRIAMRLCSDLLVVPFAKSLDREWSDATEAAADESVAHKGLAALDLASALVKIGKLVPEGNNYRLPAGAYLLEPADNSLAGRVEALVTMSERPSSPAAAASFPPAVLYAGAVLCVLAVFSLSINSTVLALVHNVTEKALAALQ